MRQRVMIAIGLACNPKLIIADEPTTALDVTIQAQILELMKDLSRRLGIALVVITHNLGIVARYADRVNVMYAARIVEQGSADNVFLEPAHPYAIGLMRSIPRLDLPRGVKLETIEGLPPDLRSPPPGCRFAPRCPYRIDACTQQDVQLEPVAPGHASACIRAKEILDGTLVASRPRIASAARQSSQQNGEPLLVVDHLKKYFAVKAAGAGFLSSETATVKAVDDVSIHVMPGETLGLVGESGCGKTTVGRAVLRLDEPTAGHDPLRRRRHHACEPCRHARRAAQDPGDLPGPLFVAQPAHDGRPDHRRADAGLQAGRRTARPSTRGSRNCSPRSACSPTWRSATRTSSPAGSASASASRARSRSSRPSSCATSRSRRSTCRSRGRSSTCSRTCRRGWA